MKASGRRITEEHFTFNRFSLLGGPFHRLGCKLGLVRGGTNTVKLGLAFGALLWTVLVLLAFVEGVVHQLFSLSLIGVHVRLLVVIPLFFLCESLVDPRLTTFVKMIASSGIVPNHSLPALEAEIARKTLQKDFWGADAMCLLAAVLLSLIGRQVHLFGIISGYDPSRGTAAVSMAGLWYWVVCLTLFRFLTFRWIFRLGLWSHFLWRMAKLDLVLIPTHPDGAAGLGFLEVVHTHFAPLVLAISATQAAAIAEGMSRGTMTFDAIFPTVTITLVVDAMLFLGPPFIFVPKLWACRVQGLSDYMEFAETYVSSFDRKWLGADNSISGEPLLGTPDLQSLADLSNSVNIVRNMSIVPVSRRQLAGLVIAALLPIFPLFLFKYPLAELITKFFLGLTGL